MQIRWTDSALRDFTHICDHIDQHSSGAIAGRVALSIHTEIDLLATFPNTGEPGASRTLVNSCSAAYLTSPFIGFAKM
jgi:plasmid stabilization system protein ParE